MKKKIKIIVPIHNALEDVKICLDSLKKHINFGTTQVMLIDDFSQQETMKYLCDFVNENTQFTLLRNEENLGFVKTCNRGLKEGNADIFVLLNSDTAIPSNFEPRIIDCFDHDTSIGIASPIASASDAYYIPIKNNTLEKINTLLLLRHKARYYTLPNAEGFCFCIHKKTLDAIGFLDEIYGKGYHEEVDFCFRAIQSGFRCALIDNLYVYHKRHASFGTAKRESQLQLNNDIFSSRWKKFNEDYRKKINFKNPIYIIALKIGILHPFSVYLHVTLTCIKNCAKKLGFKKSMFSFKRT